MLLFSVRILQTSQLSQVCHNEIQEFLGWTNSHIVHIHCTMAIVITYLSKKSNWRHTDLDTLFEKSSKIERERERLVHCSTTQFKYVRARNLKYFKIIKTDTKIYYFDCSFMPIPFLTHTHTEWMAGGWLDNDSGADRAHRFELHAYIQESFLMCGWLSECKTVCTPLLMYFFHHQHHDGIILSLSVASTIRMWNWILLARTGIYCRQAFLFNENCIQLMQCKATGTGAVAVKQFYWYTILLIQTYTQRQWTFRFESNRIKLNGVARVNSQFK